ncbi:MAG: hypothetical protein LIO63_06650 [Akkermansia sp.]|nr:hypothetical protein [Akkermansia sp.]
MPAATVPLSTPGAARPSFQKPVGFNKAKDAPDEEGEKKDHPVVLTISIVAAILALAFCFIQFKTDRIFERAAHTQRVFGTPDGADAGDGEEDYAEDEDGGEEE